MQVFFTTFSTTLTARQLAARRRKLAALLAERRIELQAWAAGGDARQAAARLAIEARAAPVVALDDACPLPDKAAWLADLTRDVIDLPPLRRPQVIYVTQEASAEGQTQALRHAVVRSYVKRDERGAWVNDVAETAMGLIEQIRAAMPQGDSPQPAANPAIVGTSSCLREAVEELGQLLRSPYGLVTGERGVGKLFLIRALGPEITRKPRVFVLPCGSFFKDYYVGGRRRSFGGGREAVDQLLPYLKESHNGILVFHELEQLPTALQQELAVHLSDSTGVVPGFPRWLGADGEGIQEYDVKIVATSTFRPEELQLKGRVMPALLSKLSKRHVRIPSLAERGPEDFALLCKDMLRRIGARLSLAAPIPIDPAALASLERSAWPGNLSDLVRVLEHAVWRSRGGPIKPAHLPDGLSAVRPRNGLPALDQVVADAQRVAIRNALEQTGGDVSAAAAILGRNKGSLFRIMKSLGMATSARNHKRPTA